MFQLWYIASGICSLHDSLCLTYHLMFGFEICQHVNIPELFLRYFLGSLIPGNFSQKFLNSFLSTWIDNLWQKSRIKGNIVMSKMIMCDGSTNNNVCGRVWTSQCSLTWNYVPQWNKTLWLLCCKISTKLYTSSGHQYMWMRNNEDDLYLNLYHYIC